MTAVVWANVLLTVPFLIAFIGVPLWMTFTSPQTGRGHSQAHAYLRSKAAFAEAGAMTPAAVTSGTGSPAVEGYLTAGSRQRKQGMSTPATDRRLAA